MPSPQAVEDTKSAGSSMPCRRSVSAIGRTTSRDLSAPCLMPRRCSGYRMTRRRRHDQRLSESGRVYTDGVCSHPPCRGRYDTGFSVRTLTRHERPTKHASAHSATRPWCRARASSAQVQLYPTTTLCQLSAPPQNSEICTAQLVHGFMYATANVWGACLRKGSS